MPPWSLRFRRFLARRRRRPWRYVSGRRHGVGVAAFSLLVLLAYAYWALTNEARVQAQVVRYLSQLTGGRVKVDHAEFSMFGGIRVRNLRLFLSDEIDAAFFEAPQVLINHRPSGLMLRSRLEPTEIVCVKPRVRLVQDVRSGQFKLGRLFPLSRRGGALPAQAELPAIRLREGELVFEDLEDGQRLPVAKEPLPWVVTLLPSREGRVYQVSFEGQEGTIRYSGTIDTVSGATTFTGQMIGLSNLDKALPRNLRQWRQRYKLDGRVRYAGDVQLGRSDTTTGPAELKRLTVELEDVSMELPPSEGGLKLSEVCGELTFSSSQVKIERLTGRIAQAGGAAFTLTGTYQGYEPTSPFEVSMEIPEVRLPLSPQTMQAWGARAGKFHDDLDPAGGMHVRATLRRDEAGELHVEGLAELRGVAMRLPYWPIRVEQMSGQISLSDRRVEFRGLRGRYERATVEIAGWLADPLGEPSSDITVSTRDVPLSREVYEALPERFRRGWDALSPRGRADFQIHASSAHGRRNAEVTIGLTGGASMEYVDFPYRLEGLEGQLYVDSRGTQLRGIHGKAGPMRCTLNGTIAAGEGPSPFELVIEATDVPLEGPLASALPEHAREGYRACGLSGRADVTKAIVRRREGAGVEFEVPAALKDATVEHQRFPCRVEGTTGTVMVRSEGIDIEHLIGRHGRAEVHLAGEVPLPGSKGDSSLEVEAFGMPLGDELREALPPAARRAWDMLDPAGTADVTISVRSPAEQEKAPPEYRLTVRPRDMRVRYRGFPYPLHLTGGQAVAVPGKLTLTDLTGQAGSADLSLVGEVCTEPGREQADLRLTTGPIPIDKQFLSALPAGLAEGLRLLPGGTVALALKSLRLGPSGGATTRPAVPGAAAEAAPSQTPDPSFQVLRPPAATTRPAEDLPWSLSGKIVFRDTTMDVGLGSKRFTGSLEGQLASAGPLGSLSVAAELMLESLEIGSRQVFKLTGKLAKTPESSILRVDDVSGRCYGGQLAGRAEVRIVPPRKYGLSFSVENVELAEFLNPGQGDGAKETEVQGLLTGNLQMTETVGEPASRRAKGELRITRGKIYRLPILLGFLHVINLTLPTKSAFQGAEVQYFLEGEKLVFQEIYLSGSALSMLGAGKMNTATEALNLTFLAGPARKLPRLASPIQELLEGIASQVMTIRVTGTLSDPKLLTLPLRNLEKTLSELYNPEAD